MDTFFACLFHFALAPLNANEVGLSRNSIQVSATAVVANTERKITTAVVKRIICDFDPTSAHAWFRYFTSP
jgi:hypothetical protein